MKHTARKLLSRLMVLAILFSFVPTALAEEVAGRAAQTPAYISLSRTSGASIKSDGNNSYSVTLDTAANSTTVRATARSADGTEISDIPITWTVSDKNSAISTSTSGNVCTVTRNSTASDSATITASYTSGGKTIRATLYVTLNSTSTGTIGITLSQSSLSYVGQTVTATASVPSGNSSSYRYVWSSNYPSILSNSGYNYNNGYYDQYGNWHYYYDDDYNYNYGWGNSSSTFTVVGGVASSTNVTISVDVYNSSGTKIGTGSRTITVTARAAEISATAYAYTGSSIYFSDATYGSSTSYGTSIYDQLVSAVSGKGYTLSYVRFTGTSSTAGYLSANTSTNYYATYYNNNNGYYQSQLANVTFTPQYAGTAYFPFTAYTTSNHSFYGLLTIVVDGGYTSTGSSGDIVYTGTTGGEVNFDSSDFENFWNSLYPNGYLEYVTFSSPSGGTLRDSSGRTATSRNYYASATGSQYSLDDVYLSNSSNRVTTVTVRFTATGTTRSTTASGAYRTTRSGVVTVLFTNTAADITYNLGAGRTVSLSVSDFTAAYKEATGSNAPSNMTVVFQDVPASGTLTYTNSSTSGSRAVTLTSRNVRSYSFTTRSTGANRLSDVTYDAPASGRNESIEFIAYNGSSNAVFRGTVTFKSSDVGAAPTNLLVSEVCTSSTGITLTPSKFTAANATAMASAALVTLGSPSSGTLVYTSTGGNAANVSVALSNLSGVMYRPNAGFTGTDSFGFTAYTLSGNVVASGRVSVIVSTSGTTVNPGTPSSGGVTSVSQFTDVSASAWYRTYLADLVSKGIIAGEGNGRFNPLGKVNNGAALKMILKAAGYPTQTEIPGNNWAVNYKNLAVSSNLISDSVDLNANITRDAVAELAAKALGLSPVSSGSPFTDSTNGYVTALYNAGIITGDTNASGQNVFRGSETLQRQEICAIIYRMNQYYSNKTGSNKPEWL